MFLKIFSRSKPSQCIVQKSFGGQWKNTSGEEIALCEGGCLTSTQMDGVKKICMDKLYTSIVHESCLVYSFGLADDWSFEENMARIGCKVLLND